MIKLAFYTTAGVLMFQNEGIMHLGMCYCLWRVWTKSRNKIKGNKTIINYLCWNMKWCILEHAC